MIRYVFITGGVVSSLGKGIASAALGALLQARGYGVRLRKLDPYLNVDPGTMSPTQHGEVFVTEGQIGREVLLILDGTAAVARSGEEVAVVGAGDFVGERAVLLGEPRNASLIATTDLEVIVYSVAEFRSLIYSSYSLDIKLRELVKSRG